MPNSRLELSLIDQAGTTIHEYAFRGNVTGSMMGVAEKFTPSRTYDTFTLNAKLYQGEDIVDESSVTYDCQAIDPALCVVESSGMGETFLEFLVEIIAVLIAISALIYFMQRSRTWEKQKVIRKERELTKATKL